MLNLERLRVLQAIAVYGSVSGAADVLHVTTSAVSQQIRKLEQETGHKLVKRSGRGIELTFIAQRLASRASAVLALVEETEAELQESIGAPIGQLTLGAFPTAVRGLVPDALKLLMTRAPDLTVLVRELDFDSPLVLVERGDLDVGIVQDWEHVPIVWPDTVRRKLLLTDRAMVALPAFHRLASSSQLRISDLVQEGWISRVRRSTCHEWLVHTMRSNSAEPRIVHTVNEHSTQLALVAAGVGLAMVPTLGLAPVPADVQVLPVEPALTRRVFAVWRSEGSVRPSLRATVDALSGAGAELSRTC